MQTSLRNKILEAKGIYKKFGNRYALQDINLVVYEHEIFGLIGPDGAGKTTLLRIFAQYSTNKKKDWLTCGDESIKKADTYI